MTEPTHRDLLADGAGIAPTQLPADPATAEFASATPDLLPELVARFPASSLGWALLAEQALADDFMASTIAGYAYARTGYHRGLDALRRSGWRGSGPVPWEHEPNRGFLRALHALAIAAGRIGETEEQQRCAQFLRDSSQTAYDELTR
jgi:hypothetical protein